LKGVLTAFPVMVKLKEYHIPMAMPERHSIVIRAQVVMKQELKPRNKKRKQGMLNAAFKEQKPDSTGVNKAFELPRSQWLNIAFPLFITEFVYLIIGLKKSELTGGTQ
jgi:hypothetical protein